MEMATTVVNIHAEACDQYIGRPEKGQDGYFGNPHPVYQAGKPWTECKLCKCRHSRGEALQAYIKDFNGRIASDSVFRARGEGLRGNKLGCFCRPAKGFGGKLLCHGQVIAAYLNGIKPEEVG